MILKYLSLIFFCFNAYAFCNDKPNVGSIELKWENINNRNAVKTTLLQNQVFGIKPKSKATFTPTTGLKINIQLEEKWIKNGGKTDNVLTFASITSPSIPGIYSGKITQKEQSINFHVMIPYLDKNTDDGFIYIKGKKHQIGYYKDPSKGSQKVSYFQKSYAPPKWFFLHDKKYFKYPISKYCLFSDFVTKPYSEGKPRPRHSKVFTYSPEVLIRFDQILDHTLKQNENLFKKVKVLSFYRTPKYNKDVVKTGGFSRHLYGDAIDWMIDLEVPFYKMDDLNRDKKLNYKDGLFFTNSFKDLVCKKHIPPGGMGLYGTKRGASMHIDTRGHLARWGGGNSPEWWVDKDLPKWLSDLEPKNILKKRHKK